MSFKHKFQNELNLEFVDYEPATLIVGTFIPELAAGEGVPWFYGRTEHNCFWSVLPRLYGEASLINASPADWRLFCRRNKIAITDIISAIDDADLADPGHVKILAGFSDKALAYHFDDFDTVNIVQVLQRRPAIQNVYFTRGVTEAFWRHLWNPVMQYCNRNSLHERKLLTPSPDAQYQHEEYNRQNPENKIPLLEDYILMRWREEWHDML